MKKQNDVKFISRKKKPDRRKAEPKDKFVPYRRRWIDVDGEMVEIISERGHQILSSIRF